MKKLILSGFLLLAAQGFAQTANDASFKGGNEALSSYLSKNIDYDSKKITTNGIVYVEFSVGEDGKIKDAKVLRGLNETLDKIAIDAIMNMPAWEPAKNEKGKPVKSKLVLPIKFEA